MKIENNNIYNMDCLEGMRLIEDNSIDYIFTSPPYNRLNNDKYEEYDDNLNGDKWLELMRDVVIEGLRILRDDGYMFFNIQKTSHNYVEYFKLQGMFPNDIVEAIIWTKPNPQPSTLGGVTNAYETIFVLNKKSKPLRALKKDMITKNVISFGVNSSNPYSKVHGAVMNLKVADDLFQNISILRALCLICLWGQAQPRLHP